MVKNAHVFWFTGLSGVGKSTLAEVVQNRLKKKGLKVLVFDGDVIRSMRHKHLGFTPPEIKTNNALIAELRANNRAHYDCNSCAPAGHFIFMLTYL